MAATRQRIKHIPAGDTIRPGQSKEIVRLALDGGTGTTALAIPTAVVQSSLPSAGAGTTGFIETGSFTSARILFGGTSADENNTVNYQVVLWYPVGPTAAGDEMDYTPTVIASGLVTIGATAYTADDMDDAGTNLWADMITEVRQNSGVVANSYANDSTASLELDLHNAPGIEIETDLGTAAGVDVFLQFGENPVPFDLASRLKTLVLRVEDRLVNQGNIFYLNGGSDWFGTSGDGTKDAPFGTLTAALAASDSDNDDYIYVLNYGSNGRGAEPSFPVTLSKNRVHIIGLANPGQKWPVCKVAAGAGADTANPFLLLTGDRNEVAGFEVGGGDTAGGIHVGGGDGAYGNWIHDMWFGVTGDAVGQDGVRVVTGAAPYLTVMGCRFGTFITRDGIRFDANATRSVIGIPGYKPNIFREVPGIAINYAAAVTMPTAQNNIISRPTDTAGNGITVVATTGGTFSHNIASFGDTSQTTSPWSDAAAANTNNWFANTPAAGEVLLDFDNRWQFATASITMSAGDTGSLDERLAFTVTGLVEVEVWVECTTSLTSGGAATIIVGFIGVDTDGLFGQGTPIPFDPVNANTLLPTHGPDTPAPAYINSPGDTHCVTHGFSNSVNITYTPGTATLTGGVLKFNCRWRPIEPGATVVAGAGGAA